MPVRPMLGDVELQQVQKIEVDEDQVLVQHSIPALEGDFFQLPGRRATKVALTGVLTGPEVSQGLATWREKFRAAQPLPFVADITTSTKVNQVVIEELGVRELAGKPERFEYALTLREYIPPPKVEREAPPPPPPPPPLPPVDKGTLIVEVMVAGQPDFDYDTVTVTVEGTQQDGTPLTRTLKNQSPTWTEENMPPGQYTVKVMGPEPQALLKTTEATVRSGEQTKVTLTLDPAAPPSNIAKTFVVHFRFDRAFIEPALRQVLEKVSDYAEEHPNEKLIILGHTDLVGSEDYNQALSERRGRSVYAYLTFGRDRDAAIAEWNGLRQPAWTPPANIRDNWGTREYQFMLQDLGYYLGNIDEVHGPKTTQAVRDFQKIHGLPPTGIMDDATWPKLIEKYLDQDALAIPETQFFRNAKNGCDGGILKWLGTGEQDPVRNTQDAWRPNRRTELLFVQGAQMPCEIAKPITFDQPAPGVVGTTWCLGPGNPNNRHCFLTRQEVQPGKWLVQPAEPDRIKVSGRITNNKDEPISNAKYVLIAPDGEYLHTDANGKPDLGEGPRGEQGGRPIPNRADENGQFSYPLETLMGTYVLDIRDIEDPRLARWEQDDPAEARGSIVFDRLSPSTPPPPPPTTTEAALMRAGEVQAEPGAVGVHAVVQDGPVAPVPVNPLIVPTSRLLVVKHNHTTPARKAITLKTSARFRRKGTLTCSGNTAAIQLFKTATGGTPLKFDGTENVFRGDRLYPKGVTLFAEAVSPSATLNDYQLTLTLEPGPTPTGPPATETFTAVSLMLDICENLGAWPSYDNQVPMSEPPPAPPTTGTPTDKWYGGRTVFVQNPEGSKERALMIVRRVQPTDFSGMLILRQVRMSGNKMVGLANNTQVFENKVPTPNETARNNPDEFVTPSQDLDLWVQGKSISTTRLDTGFQLGLKGIEEDGDRVAVTVGVSPILQLESQFVLVKKSYTSPARKKVTLRTSGTFTRSGTFKVSGKTDAVRFFDQPKGGNLVTIPPAGKVYTGFQLTVGVQLFIEGISASDAESDIELSLALDPGGATDVPVDDDATALLTAIELTLDICGSRPAPGVDPPALPQPPDANNKWDGGRFLVVQDAGKNAERALLIVRKTKPRLDSSQTLVLRQVQISGKTVTALPAAATAKVQVFDQEDPKSPGTAKGNPIEIPVGNPDPNAPQNDVQFWVEGNDVSKALHDTGFQLGFKGVDDDGDRVSLTVCTFTLTVQGAYQVGGTGSTIYVAITDPSQVVTVIANISPTPSPVTPGLVTWTGGDDVPGYPLQRRVSRANIGQTIVTATMSGVTRSVTISVITVQLTAIQFNHVSGSALHIRKNKTQFVMLPEWQRGISVNPEDSPAAYALRETQGHQLTILAQFQLSLSMALTVEIRAIAPPSGRVLGEVRPQSVTFLSSGMTNFETFQLQNVQIWSTGVGVHDITWNWQARLQTTDPWTDIATSAHRIYLLLEIPKAPWQQAPYNSSNTQLPWTDVMEYSCKWAAGTKAAGTKTADYAAASDNAAARVTRAVYRLGETTPKIIEYDCPGWGASHYSSSVSNDFNCTAFLDRLGGGPGAREFVNCSDCATIVSTFANILGCDLWQSTMGDNFALNPILAIGSTTWQTACGWPGGKFTYHEVAWKGACTSNDQVFDACLQVDGDVDPTTPPHTPLLPTNLRFGNPGDGQYRDRLASPTGRPNCEPRPTTQTRRRII